MSDPQPITAEMLSEMRTRLLTPSAPIGSTPTKKRKFAAAPDRIASANEKRRAKLRQRAARTGKTDAEIEAIWAKHADPDYYSADDRVPGVMRSTLSGGTFSLRVANKHKTAE
jgi:hypothetical protein